MKTYTGVDVQIHVFLNSALVGGKWSASRLGRFTPGERAPGTHWIGGWVGPRTGPDVVKVRKILVLPGLELRPLGRPARSQSLYPLSRDKIITCEGSGNDTHALYTSIPCYVDSSRIYFSIPHSNILQTD
jgi:hypothetical protein